MMGNKEESEITVVTDLIELLDLTGVVFTFDALHCQKSGCGSEALREGPPREGTRTKQTLSTIIQSGNNYIEGACRHLVNDRMEITGGGWRRLPG